MTAYRKWGVGEVDVIQNMTAGSAAAGAAVNFGYTSKRLTFWSDGPGAYVTIGTTQFKLPTISSVTIDLHMQTTSFTSQSVVGGSPRVHYIAEW